MGTTIFGPYRNDLRALTEAQKLGFAVPACSSVLTVPSGIEDALEEDANSWIGFDDKRRATLVVELPSTQQPCVPAGMDLGDIEELENQYTWPRWTKQIFVVVSLTGLSGLEITADEAKRFLQSTTDGFELIARIEMLEIGRSGRVGAVVHQPIRRQTRRLAIQLLARGVALRPENT